MAKRVEYVLSDSLPETSKLLCQQKKSEFVVFIGEDLGPTETDYL